MNFSHCAMEDLKIIKAQQISEDAHRSALDNYYAAKQREGLAADSLKKEESYDD